MKANELKPGNLVKSGTGIYKVFAISIPQILAIQKHDEPKDSQQNVYQSDNTIIEPIPLTDEWLEKFGFNKFPNQKKYDMDNFWACGLRNGNEWHFEDLECFVKYVHQLQNLFFALTGEELTIKEDKL